MWENTTQNESHGGGFLDDSNLSSPNQKKNQVRRVQSVMALIARQVINSDEEELKLFGKPVHIAKFVGILRDFEVQSTKATCTIEDFSGSIKGVLWLEADNDTPAAIPSVKEGCYVQVFGSIRNQDGEKILMILKMFPVDDCNAITNHLLQVVFTRLAAEKMANGENQKPLVLGQTSSMSVTDAGATNPMGLTHLQEQVYKIMQSMNDSLGVSREAILKQFKQSQTKEVNDALEFFLNEGHAYTTIDNDHFKVTDSF